MLGSHPANGAFRIIRHKLEFKGKAIAEQKLKGNIKVGDVVFVCMLLAARQLSASKSNATEALRQKTELKL